MSAHRILPAKALQEMRQMAADRQKKEVPSPRGAADFNFHEPAEGTREVGSNDDVHNPELSVADDTSIQQMTYTFLCQIIMSSATMTEHCGRTTIQPADVAKAKELYVANHEDEDEDWAEEQADEDENMDDDEEGKDDDALIYDGSDNEEETYDNDDVYIDEDKYPKNNAYTPVFDAAYPPVGEISFFTDKQFSEKIFVPLIQDVTKCALPFAEGVDGMVKRAVYAFVVASLCANNE
mmetsp:Transcript_31310/g.48970  ORF Transcript_31310/g.48970 Transcript_31310/m.48970 type:complete len:237 (-) Transcript_31310:172-882(-)|eukprot:CAMPEP_0201732258 /NCGR_PEP_ID=MMETSP0593-20130828/28343_1 /ASSEMBLY_ACC=CAM_ASM_000672 /TAXON_ID=267983 /ORGANISM="Skeletonema japonicum, Strain CCMP2506" /LENGTH=236 /DNA_ID=CAMNT_0048225203 /DNA_START=41 /DNA_END=751 /DNA_ORIENTATION=+